jgi:hypothetical protein
MDALEELIKIKQQGPGDSVAMEEDDADVPDD